VLIATYLMNRSLIRSLKRGLTPYEAFYSTKPSILHIRVFGCIAYGKILKQKIHRKLMPRSKKIRLIRYESSNIYRLWDGEERSITLARDVVFNEAELTETAISHLAEAFPEEGSESVSEMAREALKLADLDSIDEEAPIIASMRSTNTYSNLPNSYSQAKRSPAAEQ
jgi:hypothetical protein